MSDRAAGAPARWRARLAALSGWRRWAVAFLLGVLAATALPPAYLLPAAVVGFTGLVWLLDGAGSPRAAFGLGWWFGFGHFTSSLYWIAAALFLDIAAFWWLVPLAVCALPAFLAIFPGLAAMVARASGAAGYGRVLALAAAWTVGEWLRSWVLSGFPWNLTGQLWGVTDASFQGAALVGVFGLGFLAVAVAGAPAVLADGRRAGLRAIVAAAAIVAAVAGFGLWRLAGAPGDDVPGVTLRIVQASIPQRLKWDPEARDRNFDRHLALSAGPGAERVSHLIWPETAGPSFLDRDPARRMALADVVPPGGLALVGTNRTTPAPTEPFQVWNSLQAVDPEGAIRGHYDKAHLVPFGEYLPMRGLLGAIGFSKVTAGSVDFSSGPGPRTIDLPGLPPVGPLICYEVIFPAHVADPARRPDWLLNLTNDGWYGRTAGPHQHVEIARARAVEEGLPLVRSANNGISAVFDRYGRVRARLGLDEAGVIDAPLPRAGPATPYARWGNALPLLLVVFGAGIALASRTQSISGRDRRPR
ncbi:MAG: apolipoprotein N-acyltransferase [Alphaproteobacteria bacterium]